MPALLGLLPPLAVALVCAARGALSDRFAAVQLAGAVTTGALMLMTFAFDQSAFGDLSLTLALVNLPGTLLIALFVERWL
jgi:multicomponent Na+:H+ antiporter subunit F